MSRLLGDDQSAAWRLIRHPMLKLKYANKSAVDGPVMMMMLLALQRDRVSRCTAGDLSVGHLPTN